MTKILSMVSHKNYNLITTNEGLVIFLIFQFNCMLYWRVHIENEIPINCLFTQWKWRYILDVGPWRWSALNMGVVDEWHSRMQDDGFFWSWAGGKKISVGSSKSGFCGQVAALAPIHLPPNKYPSSARGAQKSCRVTPLVNIDNNHNDDNMMLPNMWFEFFCGLL